MHCFQEVVLILFPQETGNCELVLRKETLGLINGDLFNHGRSYLSTKVINDLPRTWPSSKNFQGSHKITNISNLQEVVYRFIVKHLKYCL